MVTVDEETPYYQAAGMAMLRASVHTAHLSFPAWPDESAGPAAWQSWLTAAWAVPDVAEATALASPHLAAQTEAVRAAQQPTVRQARRTAMALARYLLRMRGRATPFGRFAGVTTVPFGSRTTLRWSDDHTVRVRADASWLADVTGQLESVPPLLMRLPVVVNDLAAVRGGRLVVPWPPTAAPSGAEETREVSVRLVPVVETIRATARSPIRAADLVDAVAAAHPGAAQGALETTVAQLVAAGVLISGLRAPSTTTDVLAHLLHQLDAARADDVPDAKPLTDALREARHGTHGRPPSAGCGQLTGDLRLGGKLVLPRAVAAEAATAAEALIRIGPASTARTSWRAYHRDFCARYGPGTLVPVDELTDPARGLGFPQHFTQPAVEGGATARDEALLALVQQAALDGAHEVVLDSAALATLSPVDERPRMPADLWVDIRAESPAALDRGTFTLGVSGFGRTGASLGRFLDLLDPADRHEMTHRYAERLPAVHGALAAQLSFPPSTTRLENVLRVPTALPHVIPMAEHRAPDDSHIPVADLAVAADSARLYVISRSRQQVVEPVLMHAGASHTMPPLARLLYEIPRATHPPVTSFTWGAASCLPVLPRVRYGRSILAPAQWRLNPADLPGPDASEDEWRAGLAKVREVRRLPAVLAAGSGDRRLRLDLDEPMDRAVLRTHLQKAGGHVTLTETPTAADHGWCDGRAHEVVIPLAATTPPDPAPAFLTGPAPLPVTAPDDGVVFAKLHGQPGMFDAVLARLPALLRRWPTPPPWWFARYRHPAPHLRLRLHDPDRWRASGHVAAWAADLRREGLAAEVTFDTYRPETGRYGTGPVMAAAEELFAADSAAVLAQLSCLAATRGLHPQALTAASLLDLAAAVMGGRAAGGRWLLDHPEHTDGAGPQDREARRQTFRLTAREGLADLPGGAALLAAWQARASAAGRYTSQLDPQASRVRPETVLTSLLHMHYVRARGIDPDGEAVAHKLARAVAQAQAARQAGGHQ